MKKEFNTKPKESRKKRMQRIVTIIVASVLAGLMVMGGVMAFFVQF